MSPQLSTTSQPILDEQSFQQLLSAAYVLQQHNERLLAREPKADPTQTLSEIVETQRRIHSQQMDFQATAAFIAERAQKIANADGAAVGLLEGGQLIYVGASGTAFGETGARVPLDSSLSADCLRTGQSLRAPQVEGDPRLRYSLCQERGVKALLAVPVHYEGRVAGVIELRFAKANVFQEQHVRTCQLMAGLVTEALARATESDRKQTVAAERASMLEALEKIKPQLERLNVVAPPSAMTTTAAAEALVEPSATIPESGAANQEQTEGGLDVCRGCKRPLRVQELFCGSCGLARPGQEPSAGELQSKWASLWYMQQASDTREQPADLAAASTDLEAGSASADSTAMLEDIVASQAATFADAGLAASETEVLSIPGVPAGAAMVMGSARNFLAKSRDLLHSLGKDTQAGKWLAQVWDSYRAHIYLAVAGITILIALSGWGNPVQSIAPGAMMAKAGQKGAPAPNLTVFEDLLVNLGLAEAPPSPVYLGNPNAKVWVDLHTALYYCPGSELYGKTPGGKFTTQHEAQLDQFEPAYRKSCD